MSLAGDVPRSLQLERGMVFGSMRLLKKAPNWLAINHSRSGLRSALIGKLMVLAANPMAIERQPTTQNAR
jgi:hypothetical protein